MGWLSKIFKGSDHEVVEGHSFDGYVEDPIGNTSSTSGEPYLQHEDEDIDRAIALSLLEEDQKGKTILDYESQVKEDEEFARALQESLKVESPPRVGYGNGRNTESPPQYGYGNGRKVESPPRYGFGNGKKVDSPPRYGYGNGSLGPQPISPYLTGYRICAGCHSEIGYGRFLNCMGGFWHPECFRCHGCNSPISGYEFSMYGGYPYHRSCYKEQYHPKCGVCKQFISTNAVGLIEYRAHPFWDQKYCPVHEHDGTPRCCSCERMEPHDTGYVTLEDGRKLCLECLDSAVMDTNQCQPLYLDIQEFYENLSMKVEQQVPLLLVERQALNEAMEGEKQGHHHMPETRGLCLSEEQTISTVLRRPKMGAGGRTMDMFTEPYRLTRRCEVTAILVLYGLPRLLTGSILAHEMMHAWLRLKGFRMLNPQLEEGICQVLAYMWLESELKSSSDTSNTSVSTSNTTQNSSSGSKRSPFEMKLGKFFRNQIESDISPIYGDGFRAAHQATLKYGLPRTLDHIQMTGSLPF